MSTTYGQRMSIKRAAGTIGNAVGELGTALKERHRRLMPGDIADFVLPEDLTQVEQLHRVAMFEFNRGGEVVIHAGPDPDDRPANLGPDPSPSGDSGGGHG